MYTITLYFNNYKQMRIKQILSYDSLLSAVTAYEKYLYAQKEKNLVFDKIIDQIFTDKEVINTYERLKEIKEII